jgi:hypothetical protein
MKLSVSNLAQINPNQHAQEKHKALICLLSPPLSSHHQKEKNEN